MERNRKAVHHEAATLAFYMQGGIGIDDAYVLSTEQRMIMSKVIEKHYEASAGKKDSRLI